MVCVKNGQQGIEMTDEIKALQQQGHWSELLEILSESGTGRDEGHPMCQQVV